MLVDRHDRLWAGGFGLAGVDTKTEPPRVLPPEEIPDKTRDLITALYEGEHGEIWIGKSTGLVRFRPDASPPQVLAYASAGSPAREHSRIAQRGQLEILGMLAQGHSYKTCADSLHVGLDTVRSHVRKIYERLHVHSRSEAVWKVLQEGLLRRGRGSYS
jgi:DNA-binding NarL/FixJ family response regulator